MDAQPPASPRSRYELRELIGRGGMGEVFAAWDHQLEREVALKRLRQDVEHDSTLRQRVEAEARAAARVVHPNVVTVFDSGVEDGHPFIVMERLDGRNLADEMQSGPMGPSVVCKMILQVLDGLTAAHETGLVHRDVKPSNILAAKGGNWKVADFGIAKLVDSELTLTATNEVLGSPAYLAPERISGAPATERSDLYAVGVLMYEALTGRKPFDDENPLAIAMRVRDGTYTPMSSLLPELDLSLAGVVERAMAHEPEQRFGSAREMSDALRRAATTSETDATLPIAPRAATQPLPTTDEAGAPVFDLRQAAEDQDPPMPTTAEEGSKPRSPQRVMGIVLGAVVLALVLITVATFIVLSGDGDGQTRTPAVERVPNTRDGVPAPLQDALDQLEEVISR